MKPGPYLSGRPIKPTECQAPKKASKVMAAVETTEYVPAHALLPPEKWVRASLRIQCAVCTAKFSRVRLKHHCRKGSSSSSSVSSSSSSSSLPSDSTSSSARSASTASLARRRFRHIMDRMASIAPPIVSPDQQQQPSVSEEATEEEEPQRRMDERCPTEWDASSLDGVQWVDATQLEDIRLIGSGGYGVVWLVRHQIDQTEFAAKRLVDFDCSEDGRGKFLEEIRLVSSLTHPCIVHFVGAAWTRERDLQALFEYMPNGDLRRYLTSTCARYSDGDGDDDDDSTSDSLGLADSPWKLQAAIDVVHALAHVHSFESPLVHRDLKSKNILLDGNLRAKLTDFGVSRYQSNEGTMTTGVGTGRWLAPEVMNGGGDYTTACDVFSFGVLLAELDTHLSPYRDILSVDGHQVPEVRLLLMISIGQVKPSFSTKCPQELLALAHECLSFDPCKRPRAVEIASRLGTFRKQQQHQQMDKVLIPQYQ